MKYYRIQTKTIYPENNRIASSANGEKINNADHYFIKMEKGEIINTPPLFDYFYLESFDKKEYWEWSLFDVHNFMGNASRISTCFFISEKLKILLEEFSITNPHFYYLSKLLYKGEKLNYYIFQFTGTKTFTEIFSYINFNKSIFFDPVKKENIIVNSSDEFILEYKKTYKANGNDNKLKNKKLVLKEELDFIPLETFMNDNIVSERLKQAIEVNGITGFEFSELDYEVSIAHET